jgi:hypothetical protein
MAQKAPIALRALPQRSWGRCEEIAPQVIDVERVEATMSVVIRGEDRLGLPQLVGEVPEGRWGPFPSYAIALPTRRRERLFFRSIKKHSTLRRQALLVFKHVIARELRGVDVFRQLNLKVHVFAMAEGQFAGDQIKLPHPAKAFVHHLGYGVAMGLKTLLPNAQGFGIVQSENFNISDPQSRSFYRLQSL